MSWTLSKQRRTERFNKVTEMQLRLRDEDMTERCVEMELSLYRGEGDALAEGV